MNIMNDTAWYEQKTIQQLTDWELRLLTPPGKLQRVSKQLQQRINQLIPEKVHQALTASVKAIVRTSLFTLEFIPGNPPSSGATLEASDAKAKQLLSLYKKIAAAEGAGTGAGGIVLALADFPALLGIKFKYLYETAHAYGYMTTDYRERLFILYVFQLAFSSVDKKAALLDIVKHWNVHREKLPKGPKGLQEIDWRQLQQEYRDTIDFRKMLQLLPGIGAVIGAWANYGLLDELGETATNAYRMRRLADHTGGGNLPGNDKTTK